MAQNNPPIHSPALGKPVAQSLIQRVVQGVKYIVTGADVWMGPNQPILPVAQEAGGRAFDYPIGFNQNFRPRSEEAISFGQLRQLADAHDITRLIIETRKDQLAAQRWTIKPKDSKAKPDQRCADLIAFFEQPDREHSWQDWTRLLVEDLLVLDAPTLYPRMTRGGQLYALEPIDGSTIKRLIDGDGRTPLPPDPAYQQILKGVPAADFNRDQLIYKPRNIRTHKVYGYSPVEQIIVTVTLALKRVADQLSYYDEGNLPNYIFKTPATWSADQIAQFQAWWDSITIGQTKRQGRFVPDGTDPINLKDRPEADMFDEWLARIVCYCFSVPPTPFIKQMNRATAETAQDAAIQEGLSPLKEWLKDLINFIIRKYFGVTDLVFDWEPQESIDPKTQAEIHNIYVRMGALSVDEVRQDLGFDPVGFPNAIVTNSGAVTLEEVLNPPADPAGEIAPGTPDNEGKEGAPAKKLSDPVELAKAADGGIDADPGKAQRDTLMAKLRDLFGNTKAGIVAQITRFISKDEAINSGLIGPEMAEMMADAATKQIDLAAWEVLIDPAGEELKAATVDAGRAALIAVGIEDGAEDAAGNAVELTNLAFPEAEQAAIERGAELVGKQIRDGEVVDNPNPRYAITDSTRELLKADIQAAIQDGLTMDELAAKLEASYAFSPQRAMTIARTEVANATSMGALAGYKEAASYGVQVKKKWITAEDDKVDQDICAANEEAGAIALDAPFPSGHLHPTGHPNCRCALAPVIETNQEQSHED